MNDDYDRRTLLKLIGAGSVTPALAGCSSGGGGDGDDGSDDGDATDDAGDDDGGDSTDGGVAVDHETPHPDDGTLSDAEATGESLSGGQREPGSLSAKDDPSVMLEHTPNEGQNCGTCALYVPDQNDDGFGACTAVAGKIHPCDWCLIYAEHSGSDGIACEQ